MSALARCDDTGIVSASRDGSLRACRIEEGPPAELLPRQPVQAHAGGELLPAPRRGGLGSRLPARGVEPICWQGARRAELGAQAHIARWAHVVCTRAASHRHSEFAPPTLHAWCHHSGSRPQLVQQ